MFDNLSEKLSDAFKSIQGKSKITESNIEEAIAQVRTALLEADVNFKVVKAFVAQVKEKSLGEKVIRGVDPDQQFIKIVQDELAALMGGEHEELAFDRPGIMPILVVGLNGAGKTTFSGKLAYHLTEKQKKKVYLVPADNFRPAAKDQLIKLANDNGLDYFDSDLSQHPKDIAQAGLAEAQKLGKEVVIIDTAGRLHVDEELMGQLVEVKKCLESYQPEVMLVADAMTGQEAVNVAKSFHEAVGLTGTVLSKMDSDAKGGAALSIRYSTGVPIRFISLGEKVKDLELFHPDRLAGRILDMGDVVTLVEKAQDVIDEKEAEKMMNKLEKNKFSIEDFMKQMEAMNKLGSFESILKMIPGAGGMLRQMGDLSPAKDEMKKMRIICDSMTKKERQDDKLLNTESRVGRIARGSGTTPSDVTSFIKKFRQMRQMMGGMYSMMKGGVAPGAAGMGAMGMNGFRKPPGSGKKPRKGKKRGPFGKFRR